MPPSAACSAVLHPHVGTMVENGDEVQRVLSGSSISLCLDTGHLLIGGTDPADLTRQAPDRIAHTHLKDVDSQIADKVRAGRLSYTEAVVEGMYRPLGTGDVDVETIVNTLQGNGYAGWYTLEQDTILTEEPRGEGPVTDVRTSADYVRSLLTRSPTGVTDVRGTTAHRSAGSGTHQRAVHHRPRRGHRDAARRGRRAGPGPGRDLRPDPRHRAGARRRTPT